MYINELTDKFVSYSSTLTARASEIRPLTESNAGNLEQIISDLKSLHARAENWCLLSPAEKSFTRGKMDENTAHVAKNQ